ncbi:hypothetical protein MPLB_2030030 [Mesorhizobium sp. ORS 3324]|nr:hypothetical protein MPLB_2030030 [Mesorhizobium sp. ORS 3324]
MTHGRLDAEARAGKGSRELGDQFLAGIGLGAERAGEVTRKPRWVPGPMAKLVEAGSVIVDLLEERRLRRQLNKIGGRHVKGAVAADADIGTGFANKRLGMRDDVAFGQRLGLAVKLVGQALALRDIEDGEALEKRHRLRLGIFRLGAFLLVFRDEAIGMHDGRAVLAFADIAAKGKRLPEGEPVLAGIAVFDDSAPQDQDVDAGIAAPRGGILRQAKAGLGAAPRLHPWHATALQIGDDAVCDLGIKAALQRLAAVAANFSASTMFAGLAHDQISARQSPRALPRKAGWAAKNDRKGPPSEVAGIRRTGTQVEDPERERRVAGRRGGPRRESRPHRAAGKAKSKNNDAPGAATGTARKGCPRQGAKPNGRDRLSDAKTSGLGSRAPDARLQARRCPAICALRSIICRDEPDPCG